MELTCAFNAMNQSKNDHALRKNFLNLLCNQHGIPQKDIAPGLLICDNVIIEINAKTVFEDFILSADSKVMKLLKMEAKICDETCNDRISLKSKLEDHLKAILYSDDTFVNWREYGIVPSKSLYRVLNSTMKQSIDDGSFWKKHLQFQLLKNQIDCYKDCEWEIRTRASSPTCLVHKIYELYANQINDGMLWVPFK